MREIGHDSGETFTVYEVAYLCDIGKRSIYKWIKLGIIPPDGWFKLPSTNHIRIKGDIVKKILNGGELFKEWEKNNHVQKK